MNGMASLWCSALASGWSWIGWGWKEEKGTRPGTTPKREEQRTTAVLSLVDRGVPAVARARVQALASPISRPAQLGPRMFRPPTLVSFSSTKLFDGLQIVPSQHIVRAESCHAAEYCAHQGSNRGPHPSPMPSAANLDHRFRALQLIRPGLGPRGEPGRRVTASALTLFFFFVNIFR